MAKAKGGQGKPKACADSHEEDGLGGHLQKAEDDEGGPRPQDLSISIGRSCYHTPQPSLGHRSDLHSNEEGFHVFGRDHGLVQPKGFVLEAFQ